MVSSVGRIRNAPLRKGIIVGASRRYAFINKASHIENYL